jgi:uncharacterized protein YndB with AHSA1/START domain
VDSIGLTAENQSMRVELEVVIASPPDVVFDALTARVGSWWTMTFRTPANVVLEPWAAGRFYEKWDDGGEVEYACVTRVKPGVLLALSGEMGLTGPVEGEIVFTFVGTTGGTLLHLTHQASGPIEDGTEEHYRFGWTMLLLSSFKPFVETGAIPADLRNSGARSP